MQNAIEAYSQSAKTSSSPRELEATLLLKAASQLQDVKDQWKDTGGDLNTVLHYNRQLWTVFVSSVYSDENQLPLEIKNNIASLGAFIFQHSVAVLSDPQPEKLTPLININREIAAGLHSAA